jgi:hypothetical protein
MTDKLIDELQQIFIKKINQIGKVKEVEDSEDQITVRNDESIKEYGVLSYDYPVNDLIQTEAQASTIANLLLESYKLLRKDIDMQMFGDPTLKLVDALDVPLYQKNGLNNRGVFVTTKIKTEYNGSLRSDISGRRIMGNPVVDTLLYQDTDESIVWQETDGAVNIYQGVDDNG